MSKVYETAVRIGASITKSFKGDTLNAAGALKKLTEQTKQLKAAEKSAGAYKKLSGELTRAKGRYDNASAALRRLEDAERAAGGATKESTKWRKAGEREVAAAARQLDRATKAATKNAEALTKLGVDTAKMATEQDRLTRALAATERQEKSLERYSHARERLFGKPGEKTPLVAKAGEQLRSVGETVLHLGEVGAGAAAALYEVVSRTAEAGDTAAKMLKRIGIGVEALQELRYAGERGGASIDEVDNAVGRLAISIGKYKAIKSKSGGGLAIPGLQTLNTSTGSEGGGEADPFKRLHLSAAKLALLKPERQIDVIADAMGKLKTDSDRAAVAQEIFGREGGLKLIPMLREGSAGLAKLRQEARATGGVLSKDAAEQAERFKDAQIDARLAAAGLTNTLGVALLPVATRTFNEFSSWAKKQDFQKRATQISTWIEKRGVPLFKELAGDAQSFAGTIVHVVDGAAKLAGGFDHLGYIAVGARLAPLTKTMIQIGGETFKAANALFKYAEATKAAQAAGVIPGASPPQLSAAGKAIGAAATVAMVAGAATIGYQIGEFIDEKLGASDSFAKLARWIGNDDAKEQKLSDTVAETNKVQLETRRMKHDALVRKYEGRGLSHGQALYIADRITIPSRGGGGPAIDLSNLNITIGGGSPEQIEQQLDKALDKVKAKVLDHLRHEKRRQRRTSFHDNR